MKKVFFSTLFCLLFFITPQAQDSTYARSIIRQLSSNAMHGRGACYRGDSIAAAYLAGELERLGVLPLQVGYYQRYCYSCYSFDGPICLKINGQELSPYTQFRILPIESYAKKVAASTWKRQLKDGTWIFGAESLDTYGPIVGDYRSEPVCIEVLNTAIPKRVKKIDANIPIHYHHNYLSQNVVGYVKGIVDSMIVFTAHYDHCGTMGDNVVFPGAHDNASGVATVLDLARMASEKKPYYTMVFMFFSGEESGLKGSQYAASHPLIDYSQVKLLCNIDMFCGGDDGIMFFNAKSDRTKDFYNQLLQLNAQNHAAAEIRPRDNRPNSDHWWFSDLCPSIFLLTMGGPYGGYHDPADTCDGCGLDHYNSFVSLIKCLARLD